MMVIAGDIFGGLVFFFWGRIQGLFGDCRGFGRIGWVIVTALV